MKHYSTYQSQFIEMIGSKNWPEAKLKDIVHEDCSISYGIVQPGDDIEDGVPIVRPVDMNDTHLIERESLKKTSREISDAYSRTILRGDEILICVRGTTGLISKAEGLQGCNVTRGITPLFFKPEYNKEYLYRAFLGEKVQTYIKDNTIGSTLKGINMGTLREMPVCIPTYDIQQKFVCIAEQADKSKFTSLKSQFIGMFGTLDEPKVDVKRLRDVVNSSGQYGSNSPATDYELGMPRYIRITDINDDGSLNDDIRGATDMDRKYKLMPGDIVFARTGATVGKTYLHESGDAIYAGYLIKYQMNPQKIRPAFLMAYTHSRPYYNWVSKTQKVGAQPNISAAQYDSMPVLVPTLQEQDAFLTIYKQADKSKYIN